MLKIKNLGFWYKILFCIFVSIIVVYILVDGNIIDRIYLGSIVVLVLKYLIESYKK